MKTLNSLGRVAAAFVAVLVSISGEISAQDEETPDTAHPLQVDHLPELPVGITSFGGALCDGHLYVWGGHDGAAHEYYRKGQNPTLYRLDLAQPKQWEAVNESKQGRQGLALVAHGGKLYRLGGFEARNEQGADQDLHSVASFDCFDPTSGEWTELSPMPEPRSSFDAVVLGNTLYVVGGWALAGEGNTEWCETAYSIDLSDPQSEWQPLPQPPFTRRALSVATQDNKLFVIGGMQEQGGPTRNVSIFDPQTETWSDGPELPGAQGMEGFGNSSFNVGGKIAVTTYGGHVYQLNDAGDGWNKLGSLETGRFFHRLLPISEEAFALVGGANMENGKTTDVEVVHLKR